MKSKTSGKIYLKSKYQIFLQCNTIFFLQRVLSNLHFGPCQNCMSSENLVEEIHQKLWNIKALSTGEPYTCGNVTLLRSFHRDTLSIHWQITQTFQCTFSMSVLFSRSCKTAIFNRFFKVAIATSNIINKVYNGGLVFQCYKKPLHQFKIMYLKL